MVKKKFWNDKRVIFMVLFLVIVFSAIGLRYFSGKTIPEEEETMIPVIESEKLAEEQPVVEEEPVVIIPEEVVAEFAAEKTAPKSITSLPSKVKIGDYITFKLDPPFKPTKFTWGYENKITFYSAKNNMRKGSTSVCKDTAYCYTAIEKKFKVNLNSGEYYAKIYDRGLKDFIYGYFTVK